MSAKNLSGSKGGLDMLMRSKLISSPLFSCGNIFDYLIKEIGGRITIFHNPNL